MYALVSIGEVMAEIRKSEQTEFRIGFAGDTFNTAVYCQRNLPKDQKIAYLTRVGTDPLSNSLLEFAAQENLDVTHVQIDSAANIGLYSVSTDSSGERSFHYWRDKSAARMLFASVDIERAIPTAKIIYISGISLAILSAEVRTRLMNYLEFVSRSGQSLVAFDSNYRPALWESEAVAQSVISRMWELSDIALPSIDDEMALFGDSSNDSVISRFAQKTWAACAIKRGDAGPLSPTFNPPENYHFERATSVVDTTAAGDSFNGGYLAAFLQGADEFSCLQAGHNCARQVVGVRGAISAQ